MGIYHSTPKIVTITTVRPEFRTVRRKTLDRLLEIG